MDAIEEIESTVQLALLVAIVGGIAYFAYKFHGPISDALNELKKTAQTTAQAVKPSDPGKVAIQDQKWWQQEEQIMQQGIANGLTPKQIVQQSPDSVPDWSTLGDYWNDIWNGQWLPWNWDDGTTSADPSISSDQTQSLQNVSGPVDALLAYIRGY